MCLFFRTQLVDITYMFSFLVNYCYHGFLFSLSLSVPEKHAVQAMQLLGRYSGT